MQRVETELSRTFIFDWPCETQNITDEALAINANFTITKKNEGGLYAYFYHIIIIVNDDMPQSQEKRMLSVTFDNNNNSRIDSDDNVWICYSDGKAMGGCNITDWGPVIPPCGSPHEALFFESCQFDGTKYIYTLDYRIIDSNGDLCIPNDLVQVVYEKDAKNFVSIRFHIGIFPTKQR
jgi:hypothetical protein